MLCCRSWAGIERFAVAVSVHPKAQDLAADDRWIAWALLVSLLLHAPLFAPSGAWRRGSLIDADAPPLQVRIEPLQPVQDLPPDEAAAGRDGRALSPSAPAQDPAPLLAAVEETPAGAGQTRLEGWDPRRSEAPDPADAPVRVDALLADAAPAVADDDSARAIEHANEPPALDSVIATVAPAEAAVLRRRLEREARDLLDSSALQSHLAFTDRDRRFSAVLTRQPAAGDTDIERVTAVVTTEHDGESMQTSLQIKRLTFSHFTQLVDRWDDSVLLHDDEITGRFHSNSEIHLTYDQRVAPRLLGKVTTTRGIQVNDHKGWRPRREIFAGGLETRSRRISLPDISLPVAQAAATAGSDVHVIHGDALIVFRASGDYDCVDIASRGETRRRLATDRPTYIIGTSGTELRVRGVVNGSVTVYSPERILVQDDLTYADGPGSRNDYLGLVSDGNVEIDRAEVTGAGDLAIHAAVFARRRFVVRDAGSAGRGTLFIHGSLTAGSLSRTEPRFATRIQFDPRFEGVRPPGFPQTDRYELEAWDGRWRVAETQ